MMSKNCGYRVPSPCLALSRLPVTSSMERSVYFLLDSFNDFGPRGAQTAAHRTFFVAQKEPLDSEVRVRGSNNHFGSDRDLGSWLSAVAGCGVERGSQ